MICHLLSKWKKEINEVLPEKEIDKDMEISTQSSIA